MRSNAAQYGVVLVTASSQEEAEAIAMTLLQKKLAACINCFPVQSLYVWNEKIEQSTEWQLLIKTDLTQFAALEETIRSVHSYEIPEIIALPIATGSDSYLGWIAQQTQPH